MEKILLIIFVLLLLFHIIGVALSVYVFTNPKIDQDFAGFALLTVLVVIGLSSITSHLLVIAISFGYQTDDSILNLIFILDAFTVISHAGLFAHLQYSIFSKCFKGLMRVLYERITKLIFIRLLIVYVASIGSFYFLSKSGHFYLPILSAILTAVGSGIHIILIMLIKDKAEALYIRFSSPSLEPMVTLRSLQNCDEFSTRSTNFISTDRERNKKNYLRLTSKLQTTIRISMCTCFFLVVVIAPLVAVRCNGSFISGIIISVPWKITYVMPCIYIPYEEFVTLKGARL